MSEEASDIRECRRTIAEMKHEVFFGLQEICPDLEDMPMINHYELLAAATAPKLEYGIRTKHRLEK